MATRVASPEFIGRTRELEALDEAVSRGRARDAAVVLVGGDAGIGKSRLVAEAVTRARASGSFVLEGGCVSLGSGEGLPFAPIVEALRRLSDLIERGEAGPIESLDQLRTSETSDLGRLLPEFGPATMSDTGLLERPDWVQARIFEGVLAVLRSLGEAAPVVLVIEDLHWADGSTRDLIAFLARNARSDRLTIIGTYRTDELHRRHPLRPWLSEMERLPRVVRIDLARFGRRELGAQIEAILGHRPDAALVEAIEARSEGNPFFVEELLASGVSEAADRLPATLRDVLLTRVTALPEEAQRILGVAAVAGRTAEPDLLAEVAGVDEAEIEGPLREAVAAQIVTTEQSPHGEAYRFRHALLAEAVYDDLLPSERRRLHAAYAAALEARPVPGGAEGASHLAALAYHATAAHEPVRALRAWVHAAHAATEAHAFGEAGHAYERAIDLWDAVPADDRPVDTDAGSLFYEASLIALANGRQSRALDLARAAIGVLDPVQQRDRWAAANERLARAAWILGDMDDGLAILRSTVEALEGSEPTPVRARIMASLAGTLMLRGEHAKAIVAAREAIDVARTTGSRTSEANALNTLGTSTALLGQCSAGLAILREAVTLTRQLNDVDDMGRSFANYSSVLQICGDYEASLAVATEGMAWAQSVGAAGGYGRFIAGNDVDSALALGRWDQAERIADDLVAGDPIGVNRMAMICVVGTLYVRRGRIADAARLLAEGRTLLAPLQEAQFTGPVFVGLVELALTASQPDEAASAAEEGIERIGRTGDRYYMSELLAIGARAEADRAEVARATHDGATADAAVEAAAAHRDTLAGWIASAGEDIFGGQLAVDAAISAAEVRRAEGVPDGAAWSAAVDAADRIGSAWRMAYTRYRLAEALLLARAPRQAATEALADAWARADALSAMPLRGWIEALARRSRMEISRQADTADVAHVAAAPRDDHGLTAREREVLALLVQGHTNRRIAQELFISESTAGVHVSNILGKLGVGSRTEAATVAARLGLVD